MVVEPPVWMARVLPGGWTASDLLGSPSLGACTCFPHCPHRPLVPSDPGCPPYRLCSPWLLPAGSSISGRQLPALMDQQVKAVLVSRGDSTLPPPETSWLPSSGLNVINSAESYSPVLKQNLFFFFFSFFLRPHLGHMEVPGLRVKSELQLRSCNYVGHSYVNTRSEPHL